MAHHAVEPARIGGARVNDARNFLIEAAHFRGVRPRGVDVIKPGRRAEMMSRRREAALMGGEGVGVENVLSGQILHVNKSVGRADARGEIAGAWERRAIATIVLRIGGEIFLCQFGAVAPLRASNAPDRSTP